MRAGQKEDPPGEIMKESEVSELVDMSRKSWGRGERGSSSVKTTTHCARRLIPCTVPDGSHHAPHTVTLCQMAHTTHRIVTL